MGTACRAVALRRLVSYGQAALVCRVVPSHVEAASGDAQPARVRQSRMGCVSKALASWGSDGSSSYGTVCCGNASRGKAGQHSQGVLGPAQMRLGGAVVDWPRAATRVVFSPRAAAVNRKPAVYLVVAERHVAVRLGRDCDGQPRQQGLVKVRYVRARQGQAGCGLPGFGPVSQ
jgi:hypothetical protein